jgi:malonyl-CoA O-methyltransferase
MSNQTINAHKRVIRAFSGKSESYSTWARFQKEAAVCLSDWLPGNVNGPVLEAGAGTGIFTRFLSEKYPDLPMLITDASAEMLMVCSQEFSRSRHFGADHGCDTQLAAATSLNQLKIDVHHHEHSYNENDITNGHNPEVRFAVYNPEEEGPLPGNYDLVASALTAQWFSDFNTGLSMLAGSVSDGGHIIVSYLTSRSFPEWAEKCTELDIPFTANRLPDEGSGGAVLRSLGFQVQSGHISMKIGYRSALDFFRSLKYTGASTQLGGIKNSTSDMKRLISAMNQSAGREHQHENIAITYGLDIVAGIKTGQPAKFNYQ